MAVTFVTKNVAADIIRHCTNATGLADDIRRYDGVRYMADDIRRYDGAYHIIRREHL